MFVLTETLATMGGVYLLKKTFDRAPRRKVPLAGIVSPASGKVISIQTINPKEFTFIKKGVSNTVSLPGLGARATMIVIEMNIRDVHVQRAPIAGRVVYSKHIAGKHKNVLHNKQKVDSFIKNEKQITVSEGDEFSVGVIQVAGFVARRITTKVRVGQKIKKGSIIGRISFGSQTILILPNSKNLSIKVGDRVTDGTTVIQS